MARREGRAGSRPIRRDVVFRVRHADGGPLHSTPTILSMTAYARTRLERSALPDYAEPTSLGVPVIMAPPTPEAFAVTTSAWPSLAHSAAEWSGTVLADLGRLSPTHSPAASLLPASDLVVLVTSDDAAGRHRLRDRIAVLTPLLAPTGTDTRRLADRRGVRRQGLV